MNFRWHYIFFNVRWVNFNSITMNIGNCVMEAPMKKIIAVFCLVAGFYGATASPEWKLKKENDHMRIFTASAAQSAYKMVKVECTVQGGFAQVIGVLFDINEH